MESIQVRYSKIGPNYYHKYIVYTDGNGTEFAARGGPERGGVFSTPESTPGLGISSFGKIVTDYGPLDVNFPDFDGQNDDPSETIIMGPDLSAYWAAIKNAMDDIEAENYLYLPVQQNSNGTVDEALNRASLPAPQLDNFGENWAPASGVPLFYHPQNPIFSIPLFILSHLSPLLSVPGMNVVITFSPLVIDIDNSSTIDLVSLANSTARFDFWGDGFAEATAWVDASDGLLVHDLDADGLIENVGELFGSGYSLDYAMDAGLLAEENGFAKLAALDTNADGLVDSSDAAWNELQVWQDTNQDGISQAEELHSLSSLGIASFDVAGYQNAPYYGNGVWGRVIEGNVITHTGTVNMSGGGTREIVDAWFELDLQNTGYTQDYTLDVRTLFLPTLRGYGQVPRREARSRETAERVRQLLLEHFLIYRADGAAIAYGVANDNAESTKPRCDRRVS